MKISLGVAQIIHYCATLGHSTGIVNGAVTLSHHLSPDVSNLITSLFNGPGPVQDRFYINHFTFWNHFKKIQFFCADSSKLYRASTDEIRWLQKNQAILHNGDIDWRVAIDNRMPGLWAAVNPPRTKDGLSQDSRLSEIYKKCLSALQQISNP
ncbi:hypothetical protein P8452_43027 [Trifolium repens]|nr:hypothetical protein P8452_43027 [Trifolium repens]